MKTDERESRTPASFEAGEDRRPSRKRRKYADSAMEATVDALFNKRLEISGEFSLPDVDAMFRSPAWSDERLLRLKRDLNAIKSKLNDYDLSKWNSHTRRRNKAAEVLRCLRDDLGVEYLTQAWCKFYENASLFPLVSVDALKSGKFRSVHLCEAPGAFVASLNHWLRSRASAIDWSWLGTTLNPHYEGHSLKDMIKVDGLINETEGNWHWGEDGTGDLTTLENLDSLVERAGANTADLVTADGSVDCVDTPDEQEDVVSHLHYCEAIAALRLLAPGGNFLMKIFTIFESRSVCLVYLLACCFKRVIVNKPVNSREGNSEVYLVCLGFKGAELVAPYSETLRRRYENLSRESMFRREDLPDDIVKRVVECGEFFGAHQCEAILANMRTFGCEAGRLEPDIGETKRLVARRFIETYELRSLESQDARILGDKRGEPSDATISDSSRLPSSYNSRRKLRDLEPRKLLAVLTREMDSIDAPADGDKFKLDVVHPELAISTGKTYEIIESSKFCGARALRTYNEILRLASELGFRERIPSSDSVEAFVVRNHFSIDRVACFEYTSSVNNHELIERVRDALKTKVEVDESLVLLGYRMLSRLSVGLLYLLACTFEAVEIEASDKLGSVVTLARYSGNTEVTRMLEEIFEASMAAKERGHVVLSVLPIKTLLGSSRYREIGRMNHGIMRHCVRHVADSLKEPDERTA